MRKKTKDEMVRHSRHPAAPCSLLELQGGDPPLYPGCQGAGRAPGQTRVEENEASSHLSKRHQEKHVHRGQVGA